MVSETRGSIPLFVPSVSRLWCFAVGVCVSVYTNNTHYILM